METEAYPFEEMINELAGIFGLYFGFSVTSLAPIFFVAVEKLRKRTAGRKSMDLATAMKYCKTAIFENDFFNFLLHRLIKADESIIKTLDILHCTLNAEDEEKTNSCKENKKSVA